MAIAIAIVIDIVIAIVIVIDIDISIDVSITIGIDAITCAAMIIKIVTLKARGTEAPIAMFIVTFLAM